jgi:hypothetical protein
MFIVFESEKERKKAVNTDKVSVRSFWIEGEAVSIKNVMRVYSWDNMRLGKSQARQKVAHRL